MRRTSLPRRGALVLLIAVVPAAIAATAIAATAASEPAPVRAAATEQVWSVPVQLASPSTKDRNGRPYASRLSPQHVLAAPANRFTAKVDATVPAGATVAVELRGVDAGRKWTEWYDLTAQPVLLPVSVGEVQARVSVWGNASVRGVEIRAASAVNYNLAPLVAAAAAPLRYRLFATREGLVGHTTANGHVIKARDHFVALPSRRGLAPNGSTQYSVRVCNPANGRCETAPVWDVGPWNTKDDYWNPSATRQMWKTLPQGKPEAQAAYQDGFNGGRDEFNRVVANPAGIDLADGTFWDGLGMTNNGWVDVTFLWTGTTTPTPTWPTLRNGASGEDVRTVQYLLNQRGAGLTVDGAYGSRTVSAVTSFQRANGLTADGVVGPATWPKLVMTVQQGASGNAVRALQSQLSAHGYAVAVDGAFGSGTNTAVRSFQSSRGLTVDGVAGANTWRALARRFQWAGCWERGVDIEVPLYLGRSILSRDLSAWWKGHPQGEAYWFASKACRHG